MADRANDSADRCGIFYWKTPLPPKLYVRLNELQSYLTPEFLRDVVLPLQQHRFGVPANKNKDEKETNIPLRLVYWFLTNYAKEKQIVYTIDDPDSPVCGLVKPSARYTEWLGQYKRGRFDIYRRNTRIYFQLDGKEEESTVAQLNFCVFAHMFKVLDYVIDHVQQIHDHRAAAYERQKRKRDEIKSIDNGNVNKRQRLSRKPTAQCYAYQVPMVVKFDPTEE